MRTFEVACVRCAIKRANIKGSKQVGIDYINQWANKMRDYNPNIKNIFLCYEKYFKMKNKKRNNNK